MKNLLFASTLLLSAVTYSQDNLVAADDNVKNENMLSYQLNEVLVPDTKEILLGELDAKSKKGMNIAKGSKHAYYFENTVGSEGIFLKSMLFKVQKVKYRTEVRIYLYKKHDYMQDIYVASGTISYPSFIPGDKIETKEIVVYLEPGQKGVIEVDLSKYDIAMSAEGLFVSLEGVGYSDAEGNEMTGLKPNEMTWIDFHPTTGDNYCGLAMTQGSEKTFWINNNKWTKTDFKYAFKKEPSKKILTAPNFGLKVGSK
jgi:hypothetical protein